MPERQHELSHREALGVAEREHRERLRRVDLDQRQIHAAIPADHGAGEPAPGREPHLDARRALDHVGVGDDVAARVNDEARAEGPARPVLGVRLLGRPLDADLDERRLQLVGEPRQRLVEPDELRLRHDCGVLPPERARGRARRLGGRRAGEHEARGDAENPPRHPHRPSTSARPTGRRALTLSEIHGLGAGYRPRRPTMWESSGRMRRSTASRQAAGEPGKEKTARPARTPAWARESIAADPISW
jgi:hypothetical protein